MREEYELVKHPHLNHVNLFLVDMEYRAPHLHREFEMDWIVAGEASFIIGNTSCPVQTGSVILLNPNQLHEIKTQAGPITILSLQLSPKFFAGAVPGMDTLFFDAPLPMNVLPQTLQNGIQDRLLRLAAAYFEKAPYFESACMSILADLIHFCLLYARTAAGGPKARGAHPQDY